MILAEHLESDTASTNTLIDPYVEDTQSTKKTPRHLGKLLIASIFMNIIAFSFSLARNVPLGESLLSIANILGCILTLPHHFAALLVLWLHSHHSESIFPFQPHSPKAVAYNILLIVIWVAATTLSAVTLHSDIVIPLDHCTIVSINSSTLGCLPMPYLYKVRGIAEYWPSFASTLTSALALILVATVALVCYMHGRRIQKITSGPPMRHRFESQAKVFSA